MNFAKDTVISLHHFEDMSKAQRKKNKFCVFADENWSNRKASERSASAGGSLPIVLNLYITLRARNHK